MNHLRQLYGLDPNADCQMVPNVEPGVVIEQSPEDGLSSAQTGSTFLTQKRAQPPDSFADAQQTSGGGQSEQCFGATNVSAWAVLRTPSQTTTEVPPSHTAETSRSTGLAPINTKAAAPVLHTAFKLSPRRPTEQQVSPRQIANAAGFPMTQAERYEWLALNTTQSPRRQQIDVSNAQDPDVSEPLSQIKETEEYSSYKTVQTSMAHSGNPPQGGTPPPRTPKTGRRAPSQGSSRPSPMITTDVLSGASTLYPSPGLRTPSSIRSGSPKRLLSPKLGDDWEDEVDDLLQWTEGLGGGGIQSPSAGTTNMSFF